jgi:hypothetical protein
VFKFWGIVHETVQKILGYNIPMSYMILYLCNFNSAEESIRVRDKYLVKILLIAGKKAITRKWGKVEPPCKGRMDRHSGGNLCHGETDTPPKTTTSTARRKVGEMDHIQNQNQRRGI